MLCPDFLGPNTCTLHYLEVVGVGVVMEHAPIVQEVCQEGGAEVLKVAGEPWHYQQLRQSSVFYRSVRSPVTCLARARFKAHSKNQATTPLYEVLGTRYPKIGVLHEVKLKVHHPNIYNAMQCSTPGKRKHYTYIKYSYLQYVNSHNLML